MATILAFLNGKKTYITSIGIIVFAAARMFGIELGLSQEQFETAILGLIGVVQAFLRAGVTKSGPNQAPQ